MPSLWPPLSTMVRSSHAHQCWPVSRSGPMCSGCPSNFSTSSSGLPADNQEDTALPSSSPTGLQAQVALSKYLWSLYTTNSDIQHPPLSLPPSPEISIPVNPEPEAPPSPPNAGNVEQPLAYTPSFQDRLRRQGWQTLLCRPDLRTHLPAMRSVGCLAF